MRLQKQYGLVLLLTLPFFTLAQNSYCIIKDLDLDGIKDSVYLDLNKSTIVCKLSTKNYRAIDSLPFEYFENHSSLSETESGFSFSSNAMRSGASADFRYNFEGAFN